MVEFMVNAVLQMVASNRFTQILVQDLSSIDPEFIQTLTQISTISELNLILIFYQISQIIPDYRSCQNRLYSTFGLGQD